MARWAISGWVCSVAAISMRTGSRSRLPASASTSGEGGRENRFWRRCGSSCSTVCNSSENPDPAGDRPIQHTGVDLAHCSALFCTRSSSRPGVATTTSGAPRRRIICGLIETPYSTATLVRVGRPTRTGWNTAHLGMPAHAWAPKPERWDPFAGGVLQGLQQRQGKGGGFPGAGLGAGQDIASFQHRWNGRCLHRRGRSETTGHSGLGKRWG